MSTCKSGASVEYAHSPYLFFESGTELRCFRQLRIITRSIQRSSVEGIRQLPYVLGDVGRCVLLLEEAVLSGRRRGSGNVGGRHVLADAGTNVTGRRSSRSVAADIGLKRAQIATGSRAFRTELTSTLLRLRSQ